MSGAQRLHSPASPETAPGIKSNTGGLEGQAERWKEWLILITGVVLLCGGLGTRALWGSEGRWAQIAREMLATGDFFHPTIGGEAYFDKPLLTYWVIAIIAAVTGAVNETVARLPSALAGLAAVWATMKLGQRLWSRNVGWIAGVVLLTSYGFLFWSRTAAADTENLAAVILAVAWYWFRRERLDFSAFLVFYLILFLGALMKGLPALVLPFVAIFPDVIQDRRWRKFLTAPHFLALGIGALLYIFPFVWASHTQPPDYQRSGLALVFKENIVRFFEPFDHKEPVYLYLYMLPLLLFPWIPLLFGAILSFGRSWKQLDRQTRWLLWASGLIFLFFTASGSRRGYYILPLLPFCALMLGIFVDGLLHGSESTLASSLKLQRWLIQGFGTLMLLSPLALPLLRSKIGFEAPPFFAAALVCVGLGTVLVPWMAMQSQLFKSFYAGQADMAALALMGVILMGGTLGWQQNLMDQIRTERPFALQLKEMLTGYTPDRVAFFRGADAKLAFYLDTPEPIRIVRGEEGLRAFLAEPSPSVLIAQPHTLKSIPPELLTELNRAETLVEPTQPWDPKSDGKRKWVAWFWPPPAEASGSPSINAVAPSQ